MISPKKMTLIAPYTSRLNKHSGSLSDSAGRHSPVLSFLELSSMMSHKILLQSGLSCVLSIVQAKKVTWKKTVTDKYTKSQHNCTLPFPTFQGTYVTMADNCLRQKPTVLETVGSCCYKLLKVSFFTCTHTHTFFSSMRFIAMQWLMIFLSGYFVFNQTLKLIHSPHSLW